MKHLFIINPVAGKGKALLLLPEIERIFFTLKEEYIIEISKYQGHATEIVKRYVEKGVYRVYSVGGDGTLNEILNGMINSNSSLAVIPGGSGNDFFRSINKGNGIKDIFFRTIIGSEKVIDIAKVNERYFLNISSVGFDAETAFNARLIKRIPFISGSFAYILGILITVIKNKKYNVNITHDNKNYNGKILLAAIANGRYYGGGILPAPEAILDDGKLDICIVKAIGRFKILILLHKYMKGKHTGMKEVNLYKAGKIEIDCEESLPLNIDGEVYKVNKVTFEIIPKGIKIVIPE